MIVYMAIKVFWHICAINHVVDVVQAQLTMLLFSPLYDRAQKIYVTIAGDFDRAEVVRAMIQRSGSKFEVIAFAPGDTTYERLMLEKVHLYIDPMDKLFYFHSKTTSIKEIPRRFNAWDWTYMMCYQLIKRCEECITLLDSYDTVGVNMSYTIAPHYSGNFWWARGDYFLRLPKQIGGNYLDPETKFLFTRNPRFYTLFSTNVNHYVRDYPPNKYVD